MSTITTREHLDNAPALGLSQVDAPSITRAITLAKCLRCEFEWLPRKANPVKCPHCGTPLWNVPRAQQLPGKPAPTRKGKPRGKPLQKGADPRHSSNARRAAKDKTVAQPEDG